jgi:Fe-S cluster assembly protein SufD
MQEAITIKTSKSRKIKLNKAGRYIYVIRNCSGLLDFQIEVPGIELFVYGYYHGSEKDHFTLRTIQHHKAPMSASNLFVKGVFSDKSIFDYKGLIKIEKNCNGSNAYQRNQNLVLSDHVTVNSEPDLEILSPDVYCTHGSTTGKMNEESLFYMQCRGLSMSQAKKLYINGFFTELNILIKRAQNNNH